MNLLLRRLAREPNAVVGLVTAAINLAVLFGWHVTVEQLAGINAVVGAVVVLIRGIVTPTIPAAPPAPTQDV